MSPNERNEKNQGAGSAPRRALHGGLAPAAVGACGSTFVAVGMLSLLNVFPPLLVFPLAAFIQVQGV